MPGPVPGPWWGPAAIGAAGSIVGGLLGGGGQGINQHKKRERAQMDANLKTTELGQTPIQWITQDAKKAGIHPLYALGNQGSQPTAQIPPPGQSESGSHLGEGIRQASRYVAGALERANIRALDAQAAKSSAEGALALSKAKRLEGAANHNQDAQIFAGDRIRVDPAVTQSHAKGEKWRTAATVPGATEVSLPSGYTMLVPNEGTGAEDNPELMIRLFFENQKRGWQTINAYMRKFGRKVDKAFKRKTPKNLRLDYPYRRR